MVGLDHEPQRSFIFLLIAMKLDRRLIVSVVLAVVAFYYVGLSQMHTEMPSGELQFIQASSIIAGFVVFILAYSIQKH